MAATYSTFNSFLRDYFKVLHLNGMDSGQRAYLKGLRGRAVWNWSTSKYEYPDDKRGKSQKEFGEELDGPQVMPDFSSLPQVEQEKLYKIVREAIRTLEFNKSAIAEEYPDLPKKWQDFYGAKTDQDKPFYEHEITDATKVSVGNLVNFLRTGSPLASRLAFENFDNEYSFDDFLSAFDKGKFDSKFTQRVSKIVSYVYRNQGPLIAEFSAEGTDILNFLQGGEFFNMLPDLDSANESVDQSKLDIFKRPDVHKKFFELVFKNDNFRGLFKQAESDYGGHVSASAEKAKEKYDYSKVPNKLKDKLTLMQNAKKAVDGAIDGHLSKLFNRHKGWSYATNASVIVDAIVAEKIAPTDGLGKILDSIPKIEERIKGKKEAALPALKTFTTVMTKVKEGMPKAFDGALKRGHQLNHVVSKVIDICLEMGKKDDCKVILETLAVMRYGKLTSGRWEAWHDPKNRIDLGIGGKNHDFVWFFGKGLNFTANFMADTLFWAGQLAINAYNQRGTEFGMGSAKNPYQPAEGNQHGAGTNANSNQTDGQQGRNRQQQEPPEYAEFRRMRNPYDDLGVSPNATDAEIRSAFRRAAKQQHPDQNQGNEEASEEFLRVKNAYEFLKDSQKRTAYNAFKGFSQSRAQNAPRSAARPAESGTPMLSEPVATAKPAGQPIVAKMNQAAHNVNAMTVANRQAAGAAGNEAQGENQTEQARKLTDRAELMAFWDFMMTDTQRDMNVLRSHSKVQEEFTDRKDNLIGGFTHAWVEQQAA